MKGIHHSTYYNHLRAVQGTFIQATIDDPRPLAKRQLKPLFVKASFCKEENKVPLVKNGHEDNRGSICIHIKGAAIDIPENVTFELIAKVLMAVKEL